MNKHTPGPWKIRRLGKSQTIFELGPVCADEYAGSCWLDVSESDASLVCAAPDLLEALSEIINDGGKFVMTHETHRKARAAIARARGEA